MRAAIHHHIRRLSIHQDGFAVVTAIVLMTIMLGAGIAVAAYVDNGAKQSSLTRVRETSFNLGEAALNAQVFALAQSGGWPGIGVAASDRYGACTPSTGGTKCPSNSQLMGMFPSTDTSVGASWQTQVLDNAAANNTYYTESLASSAPGYDANNDGLLWVRSQATARGKTRKIVALVRLEEQNEDILHTALLSGRMDLGNNGNKVVIDNTLGGAVLVRCTPTNNESDPCMGYELGSGNTKTMSALNSQLTQQINPATWTTNYTGPSAISAEALARLKQTATAYGTKYTSCPGSLTGKVVWLVNISCSFAGNNTFNSAQSPGIVLVDGGVLTLKGTTTHFGVIYHPNSANSGDTLISVTGNACIEGGVIIEGLGVSEFGNSGNACGGKGNVKYNPYAFGSVKTIGSAGIVQNSWRELLGG